LLAISFIRPDLSGKTDGKCDCGPDKKNHHLWNPPSVTNRSAYFMAKTDMKQQKTEPTARFFRLILGSPDGVGTRDVNGKHKDIGGKLQLTYQCNRKGEALIKSWYAIACRICLLQVGGKASSTIVLHKCSVYVINPITVVDFDNQNSTGSLES
jgi:hypothetical protein